MAVDFRRSTKAQAISNLIYATLLFIYIILPSVSTYVITFFSCRKFDRGAGNRRLKVIAAELSIECAGE